MCGEKADEKPFFSSSLVPFHAFFSYTTYQLTYLYISHSLFRPFTDDDDDFHDDGGHVLPFLPTKPLFYFYLYVATRRK